MNEMPVSKKTEKEEGKIFFLKTKSFPFPQALTKDNCSVSGEDLSEKS